MRSQCRDLSCSHPLPAFPRLHSELRMALGGKPTKSACVRESFSQASEPTRFHMGNRQDTTGNLKELVERLARSDQGHRKRHLSSTQRNNILQIYASNALFSSSEKRWFFILVDTRIQRRKLNSKRERREKEFVSSQ